MESTMGKRIIENRKRLGLTQDGLAEQLGVTAQAVSKWENDQSCPDIATLPKLAEIFGITTDELLGIEPAKKVHQAEVVHEDGEEENENDGIHLQKGNWEFKWDSSKKDALTFAILVLLVGTLVLCARLFDWDAGFWGILWPSALLVYGIRGVLGRFSFFSAGCTLFGGYYLIENLGIWDLNIGGEFVFPIIIVVFGLSLLVDALRKPNKPRFKISHNGKNVCSTDGRSKTKNHYSSGTDSFECSLSFGENHRTIDLPVLDHGDISCSFGELTVDLSGCEAVSEDCELEATCSFGELTLLVPRRFRVEPDSNTAFASLQISGQSDPEPSGIIQLDASVSFGEIRIRYV